MSASCLCRYPSDWAGSPLGYAASARQHRVAQCLAPLSSDVNPLAYFGKRERLAAILADAPARVNEPHLRTSNTPLFCLPDDEDDAIAMADFLLSRGADPAYRNREGLTAEAFVRRRGLFLAADHLAARIAPVRASDD
ncbi:hypothetical protein EON77_19540 [bacterium]|nr:MAG: hypothetical protein EON77_19540 [bacterium]